MAQLQSFRKLSAVRTYEANVFVSNEIAACCQIYVWQVFIAKISRNAIWSVRNKIYSCLRRSRIIQLIMFVGQQQLKMPYARCLATQEATTNIIQTVSYRVCSRKPHRQKQRREQKAKILSISQNAQSTKQQFSSEKMLRNEFTLAIVTFAPLNQTWCPKSNLCNSRYLRKLVFLISALQEFNHQLKQTHFQGLS